MDTDLDAGCCGPGYSSPAEAIKAPREKLLYTVALYIGTGIQKPDYLATIDADPESPTYSQVIHRLEMPGIGDELHHTGWNACSSCHDDAIHERQYLIVARRALQQHPHRRLRNRSPRPAAAQGDRRRRDQGEDRTCPGPTPSTASDRTSSSRCSATPRARRRAASCTSTRTSRSSAAGRTDGRHEVQLRLLVPAAPQRDGRREWAAPNTFMPGFDLEEVGHLKYGRQLHFWDFEKREPVADDLPRRGRPGSARGAFHHDPDCTHGFCGAALSSNIIHFCKGDGEWDWEKIIDVENERHPEWPIPLPGRDLGDPAVDGRPLPVLLQLAARRHPPVRHHRSRTTRN